MCGKKYCRIVLEQGLHPLNHHFDKKHDNVCGTIKEQLSVHHALAKA